MTIAQRIGRTVADAHVKSASTTFLNWTIASALAGSGYGAKKDAAQIFNARWPRSLHKDAIERIVKAPVDPGTTIASPLVVLEPLASAFVEFLRPLTVLGRMSSFMRPAPFQIRVPRVTSGSVAYWIGQGKVKAASALALDTVSLPHAKIAALVVVSKELAKLSDPSAEALVRADMTGAIAQGIDESFLNPTLAAVANQSPASVTYGSTEIVSSGATAAAVADDLRKLFSAITTRLTSPFLIMRPTTAVWLASLESGKAFFPNVGATGGEIWGTPVLTSANVPADANSPSENIIVLIDAAEILLAEGSIEIKTAANASIQMETAPDSPATTSTVLVDFFQRDLIGFMAEKYVYWQPRRSGAVAYLSGLLH